MNKNNPLIKVLQSITDLVGSYMKERAVTTQDIFHYVQDQLEVQAVVNEGNVSDGMMSSGMCLDVYIDTDTTYALITKDGRLYKMPVMVDVENNITTGDMQEIVMVATPVTGRQLSIKRSVDGTIRWFALPACTAALNRSGEIDSRKLFDSFIEYVNRTNDYPELDFFHAGKREQLVLGKADWIARDGINYCASGTFYNTSIALAAAKSIEENQNYWGLSIAYIPTSEPDVIRTKENFEIPVYNSGINRFISLLPEDAAASILTSISTKEEVNRMNDKVKEALKKLIGDDQVLLQEMETKLDAINRSAETMITRDTEKPETSEDELTNKITTIIEQILAKKSEVVETPVVEPVVPTVDRSKILEDAITALTVKVDALMKTREADVQQVLDDLPAKVVRQKIIRPRAAILPETVAGNRQVNLAEIAQNTLNRMTQNQ